MVIDTSRKENWDSCKGIVHWEDLSQLNSLPAVARLDRIFLKWLCLVNRTHRAEVPYGCTADRSTRKLDDPSVAAQGYNINIRVIKAFGAMTPRIINMCLCNPHRQTNPVDFVLGKK